MQFDDPWDEDDAKVVPMRHQRAGAPPRRKPMAETPRTTLISRPQLGFGDIVALLLREIPLMALVFLCIFAAGVVVAFKMPSAYTAGATLTMQLGQDYVYNPATNDAARGATATIDQVVQSEAAILNSDELKRLVIAKVGYKVVLSDTPALWNPSTPAQKAEADAAALKVMQSGLGIGTGPANAVVQLSFKHPNAVSASLILNTLIDTYLQYRRDRVYTDDLGPALQQQRKNFDDQLAVADQAYQQFLAENGVGDFVAAKATYAKVLDTATSNLYDAQSQIATDEAKLKEIDDNLATLAPEVSTERDLDLSVPNKIAALKETRQELLGRYQPTAQPVKDIDAQIASLQAMMNSGGGIGEQSHKLGANPVYQTVVGQKLDVEAELSSLKGRQQALQDQIAQVTGKLQAMTGIEAQYNDLATKRDALQKSIDTYTQKIQENDATRAMAKTSDDTVRVVERASVPVKPKSFKRIVLIMAFLFAGFTALCAGLLRVYTRKGFINADQASKVLDLPVLATAGKKAA